MVRVTDPVEEKVLADRARRLYKEAISRANQSRARHGLPLIKNID